MSGGSGVVSSRGGGGGGARAAQSAAIAAEVKRKMDHGDSDDDFMNSNRSLSRLSGSSSIVSASGAHTQPSPMLAAITAEVKRKMDNGDSDDDYIAGGLDSTRSLSRMSGGSGIIATAGAGSGVGPSSGIPAAAKPPTPPQPPESPADASAIPAVDHYARLAEDANVSSGGGNDTYDDDDDDDADDDDADDDASPSDAAHRGRPPRPFGGLPPVSGPPAGLTPVVGLYNLNEVDP